MMSLCYRVWPGYDCSIPAFRGFWSEVLPVDGAHASPVTSFASVTIENQLWILCGYSFTNGHSCSNMARYDLSGIFINNRDVTRSVNQTLPLLPYVVANFAPGSTTSSVCNCSKTFFLKSVKSLSRKKLRHFEKTLNTRPQCSNTVVG